MKSRVRIQKALKSMGSFDLIWVGSEGRVPILVASLSFQRCSSLYILTLFSLSL